MAGTIDQLVAQAYEAGRPSSRSSSDIYLDISGNLAARRAKAGEDVYGKGLETAGKSTDYWSGLLSGDRAKVAEATEPERYAIGKSFQAGRQAISMGPRGGGTSSALAESRFEEAGQIARLTQGARGEAAKSLADVGVKEAALGLSDVQTAEQNLTSIFETLLSGYTAFHAGKSSSLGQLGSAAGQIIAGLLMGGGDSSGGGGD